MTKPLKKTLREYYARERLSARQLAQLRELTEPISPQLHTNRRHVMIGLAAAVVFAIATPLLWWTTTSVDNGLTQRIADEIARNHLAQKPLDVSAGDIAGLRPAFNRLDFALMDSPRLHGQGWNLKGGRYCSVQTVPAAQLRYHTPSGAHATVYEAIYDPQMHGPLPHAGEAPLRLSARGVNVKLWVKRGLLLAIAISEDG